VGEVVLIAHNNDAFDHPFLKEEFLRAELTLPKWRTIDSLRFVKNSALISPATPFNTSANTMDSSEYCPPRAR